MTLGGNSKTEPHEWPERRSRLSNWLAHQATVTDCGPAAKGDPESPAVEPGPEAEPEPPFSTPSSAGTISSADPATGCAVRPLRKLPFAISPARSTSSASDWVGTAAGFPRPGGEAGPAGGDPGGPADRGRDARFGMVGWGIGGGRHGVAEVEAGAAGEGPAETGSTSVIVTLLLPPVG